MKTWMLAIVGLLVTAPAAAQLPAKVPDRVRLSVGGIHTDTNTAAGVGTQTGSIGTYIDFEQAFNLPVRNDQFRFDGSWRIARKHHLDFGYFDLDRASARAIDEDIEFGDYVFQAGGTVTASWGTEFPYAAYRYNFLRDPRVHISGTAGVTYLTLDVGLAATGSVTDLGGNAISGSVEEKATVDFPVPLFGLQVDWGFAENWVLDMYLRTIRINVDEFDGGMKMNGIRVEWWPWKRFGFAGGYESVELDVREFQSDDLTGRFSYSLPGVSFYLKGAF